MTSCQLVTYVSSVACAISKTYSSDEMAVLAAMFSQLGDSLATILAHEATCNSNDSAGGNKGPML